MTSPVSILKFAKIFQIEANAIYLELPNLPLVKIAFRAMQAAVKRVDMPLYVEESNGFTAITLLKINGDRMSPYGFCALDIPNVEMNEGHSPGDWARLHAIYSEDAWTAIFLLGAAVYYAANVLGKRGVVADNSVTQDAQNVIKRMFSSGQKEGIVVPEVLKAQKSTQNFPWLRAGYLNPGNADAKFASAFEEGKRIKDSIPQEYQDHLISIIHSQWNSAYEDSKERGGTLEQETIETEEPVQPIYSQENSVENNEHEENQEENSSWFSSLK